jgi:hypothetical protein
MRKANTSVGRVRRKRRFEIAQLQIGNGFPAHFRRAREAWREAQRLCHRDYALFASAVDG